MSKSEWVRCEHCEGTAVCKNQTVSITRIYWILPYHIQCSCTTCLKVNGEDKNSKLTVACGICNGTGYVYLNPEGYV